MWKTSVRQIATAVVLLVVSWSPIAVAQTMDYDLPLYVTMAPQQVTLDFGYTKRHVDSVVYINPAYDSIYHINAVDTVYYLIPDAVQRIGIWAGPSPRGIPKPNFDNDYVLRFQTVEDRDSAY